MEQEIRTVGGVVLGARVELEQPVGRLKCCALGPTQPKFNRVFGKSRTGMVWGSKELEGRGGVIQASPLSVPLARPQEKAAREASGTPCWRSSRTCQASPATLGGSSQFGEEDRQVGKGRGNWFLSQNATPPQSQEEEGRAPPAGFFFLCSDREHSLDRKRLFPLLPLGWLLGSSAPPRAAQMD